MGEHVVLGMILGAAIFANVFFGAVIVWMVRDTSKYLARLIIQGGK